MPFTKLYSLDIQGKMHTVRVVTPEYRPMRAADTSVRVVDVVDIHSGVHVYGVQPCDLSPKPADN